MDIRDGYKGNSDAYLDGVVFVNPWSEVVRVPSESDSKKFEESVHPVEQRLGTVGGGVHRGRAFEHDDPVSQVGRHDEVVLHDEARLLGVKNEALDDLGGDQTLLGIQVGGRLVHQVHVGGLAQAQRQSHSLQLSSRQILNFLIHHVVDSHRLHYICHKLKKKETNNLKHLEQNDVSIGKKGAL